MHRIVTHLFLLSSRTNVPCYLLSYTTAWLLDARKYTKWQIGEGKHLIIYNPTHAATRYESNVMHELAHLLLGHQPIHFHQVSGTIPVREYRTVDEKAAEYLEGCLQITARGLNWAFQRSMTLQEIAEHFGASIQMVRYRCNMTGHNETI